MDFRALSRAIRSFADDRCVGRLVDHTTAVTHSSTHPGAAPPTTNHRPSTMPTTTPSAAANRIKCRLVFIEHPSLYRLNSGCCRCHNCHYHVPTFPRYRSHRLSNAFVTPPVPSPPANPTGAVAFVLAVYSNCGTAQRGDH